MQNAGICDGILKLFLLQSQLSPNITHYEFFTLLLNYLELMFSPLLLLHQWINKEKSLVLTLVYACVLRIMCCFRDLDLRRTGTRSSMKMRTLFLVCIFATCQIYHSGASVCCCIHAVTKQSFQQITGILACQSRPLCLTINTTRQRSFTIRDFILTRTITKCKEKVIMYSAFRHV